MLLHCWHILKLLMILGTIDNKRVIQMHEKDIKTANCIINRTLELKMLITNAKLNQIAFLIQGQYSQTYKESLFHDKFEKWYFPVNNSIYQAYKRLGSEKISELDLINTKLHTSKNNDVNCKKLELLKSLINKLILVDDFKLVNTIRQYYKQTDTYFSKIEIRDDTNKVLKDLKII